MKFGLPPWLKPTDEVVEPEPRDLVEPTAEEARNGWDAEGLTAYLAERDRAQADTVLHRAPPKPRFANSKYNPMRWRA